jgi:3-hydroxyisobutyrate dehydrogenase-like beta-hydroxyacid dehydrogenase
MSSTEQRIGFIGDGQMGLPMLQRLVASGREVVAFARRGEARAQCEAMGARSTDDPQKAVRDATAVVVCLFDDAQIRELALGPSGFLGSMALQALLVVHTTGSPAMSRELAAQGSDREIRVVDAPVSGSAQDIEQGHVTVFLGGDSNDIETATALVAAYGDSILPIGPLGSAMAVKLLNNALFAAHVQLAGEVERVAAGFDVEMSTVASAILLGSGSSYAMSVVARYGSLAAVSDAAGPFLAKDVAAVHEVAAELGLNLGVLGHVNDHGPITFAPRKVSD